MEGNNDLGSFKKSNATLLLRLRRGEGGGGGFALARSLARAETGGISPRDRKDPRLVGRLILKKNEREKLTKGRSEKTGVSVASPPPRRAARDADHPVIR